MGTVKFIKETQDLLVVEYYGQKIQKKRFKFFEDKLVRIFVYYNNPEQMTINTYTEKYGPPKREENIYKWKFPSTVITHEAGTQIMKFRDSSYIPQAPAPGHQNIDRIEIGMTVDQVNELMGTPLSTASHAEGILYYRYSTGIVTFRVNRVIGVTKSVPEEKNKQN